MSISRVRCETLRYVYQHGPIKMTIGAARSVVRDAVAKHMQDHYGMGTESSVSIALVELVRTRALREGDGERHKRSHYLAITDVGKRELAVMLRRDDDPDLDGELRQFLPDDPIANLHATQAQIQAETAARGPDDVDPAPPVETPEEPISREPSVDASAVAHALLAKVLAATREDTDWATEVERLERVATQAQQETVEVRASYERELGGVREQVERLERELAEAQRERDGGRKVQAKLNGTIGEVRAENERLRGVVEQLRKVRNNGSAADRAQADQVQRIVRTHKDVLSREDEELLRGFAATLMTQRPGPGGDE